MGKLKITEKDGTTSKYSNIDATDVAILIQRKSMEASEERKTVLKAYLDTMQYHLKMFHAAATEAHATLERMVNEAFSWDMRFVVTEAEMKMKLAEQTIQGEEKVEVVTALTPYQKKVWGLLRQEKTVDEIAEILHPDQKYPNPTIYVKRAISIIKHKELGEKR